MRRVCLLYGGQLSVQGSDRFDKSDMPDRFDRSESLRASKGGSAAAGWRASFSYMFLPSPSSPPRIVPLPC